MKNPVGMWLDHHEAVIVFVSDHGEEVRHLESGVESQLRRYDDQPSGPFETGHVADDAVQTRIYDQSLARYYDRIIEALGDTETLFIFGPAGAKTELIRRLGTQGGPERRISVRAADRMTEAQIIATVRHFYRHDPDRVQV